MDKRKVRFFNTTGPCRPEMHYMLPPEERLVGAQLHRYIRDQLYWVLHAPRQTGKTTFLFDWMRKINRHTCRAGDEAVACYVSVERCQGIAEPERAMPAICEAIREDAKRSGIPVPKLTSSDAISMMSNILGNWAELTAPLPLVVLFDEVDVLEGETLISFLRQLRGGYANRAPGVFPVSIALVGMRDLKDYITAAKGAQDSTRTGERVLGSFSTVYPPKKLPLTEKFLGGGAPVNPGSPFNIKLDSASLSNFSQEDIRRLFAQRTEETGQQITAEALDYAWDQSSGQPWIVNNLFMRATMRILDEGSAETVTLKHLEEAREQMILARETHLDALAYRLEDPRIRKIMESLMTGEPDPLMTRGDAFRLCLDLGLVKVEQGEAPCVANPIYREVLARELIYGAQMAIPKPEWKWETPDGRLDMEALLREFQTFWRENSEVWEEQADYHEAFPHLLLMAFLQRVANGAGRIEREYAAGRGRMDLAVEYRGFWDIIEIKLLRRGKSFEKVKAEGIRQTLAYRDRIAGKIGGPPGALSPQCYLVIFDRRPDPDKPSWEERLKWLPQEDLTVVCC